jgi:amidase/6-aminohexanoate-cyclic-dimer hydrolase
LTFDYENLDAVALADLVARREASPGELLEAALARADAVNPRINAVTQDHRELARTMIAGGLPEGPLRGVPFLIKDLYATIAGTVTSNGSAFFGDNVADHDTEMVARYRRAGLVVFGKTSTPEFGLTITTEPRAFGPARNPWNPAFTTGGSSGGSAAAVAAGIVPAAHASDGGGSIRIPASCCGLFGLKPTRARNPAGPDRGDGWSGMSGEHVVSRSVRDSAALLDATRGPDAGAPYFATPPRRGYLEEVGAEAGRLRIGLATATNDGIPLHPETDRATRSAAALAESLGHVVEEVAPRFTDEGYGAAFRTIIGGNVAMSLQRHATRMGKPLAAESVETLTWLLAMQGRQQSAMDYAAAVQTIQRVGRNVGAFFADFDVLLTPTMPDPPRPLGYFRMTTDDPAGEAPKVARGTMFTSVFNASGNPAASVPLHWTPEGLPVGVQIVGRYGDEATLFRLAAQFEAAQPWFARRPRL